MGKLELRESIWEYSRAIADSLNLTIVPICDHFDLTITQTRILIALLKQGDLTIGSLAEEVKVAGTNISTICKKLDKKGLVHRKRETRDERVVKVGLTKKGKEIAMAINKELDEKIASILSTETDEELSIIIRGMEKLNEILIKMREQ